MIHDHQRFVDEMDDTVLHRDVSLFNGGHYDALGDVPFADPRMTFDVNYKLKSYFRYNLHLW